MNQEQKNKDKKNNLTTYFIIIVFVILIRTFIITPVRVNGSSMDTTLHTKEIMILNKLDYVFSDIERFDIVVIKYNDEKLIKRVIGLPKEKLEYKDDTLYINDKEVKEYFKNQKTEDFSITELGYETLPEDCYFVMGDNRSVSQDSRVLGCIKKENILGSANLVIYPFKDFGFKK